METSKLAQFKKRKLSPDYLSFTEGFQSDQRKISIKGGGGRLFRDATSERAGKI